jgi:hypothetical protein
VLRVWSGISGFAASVSVSLSVGGMYDFLASSLSLCYDLLHVNCTSSASFVLLLLELGVQLLSR